ncbi:hypothetical protein BD410DRAFT_825350 [Rickenella mellea]|uniref:Uncharacterized protein n=1 Tax=Rickenella mellea TaxID=50990 RepID=A0A4Y7QI35_9AGAM|nr:hypothetical protein BD410DRAFT_825350 [Rickenella mellea]
MLAYNSASNEIFSNRANFPFPGPAPVVSQRERYFRALEQERDAILGVGTSSSANNSSPLDFGIWSVDNVQPARVDQRGRQTDFEETVRQRQRRLEFLRRQEFARRLALKGLSSTSSTYVEKRFPTITERVQAAVKIQRAYRSYVARRQAIVAVGEIATTIDELRQTHIQYIFSISSRSSSRSKVRRDLALREYEDQLRLLRDELEEVLKQLTKADALFLASGWVLLARLGEEIEELDGLATTLRTQTVSAAHSVHMTVIDEESEDDALLAELSFTSTTKTTTSRLHLIPRRAGRRVLMRRPSLHSIEEEEF